MKKTLDILLRIIGALALAFILLVLFNRATSQTDGIWKVPAPMPVQKNALGKFFDGYRVTPGKVGAWVGYAIAGAAWGAREAYHSDLHVFEKKWGVDPYSFWGSEAWQRNYQGNRYQGEDGGTNPHKGDLGNTFRDVHHFTGVAHAGLVVGCTFGLAAGKQKLRHKLLDVAIGMVVRSAVSHVTYSYLRG